MYNEKKWLKIWKYEEFLLDEIAKIWILHIFEFDTNGRSRAILEFIITDW